MKNVLVIFGGASSEHDVSLVSANSVIKNIPTDKYNVILLGITKEGEWLHFKGDVDLLPNDKWIVDEFCCPAIISPDAKNGGLIIFEKDGSITNIKIDVVFPVLHGKNGEDGTIQGLFQLANIPFVGCDSLSSAASMDKGYTNMVADYLGVPQAKWVATKKFSYNKNPDKFIQNTVEYLGFPIFVKPANAGSSVGITKATDIDSLRKAIDIAFEHDNKVVFEENIDGFEVECAVLGNDELFASVVGGITPCNEFYDYEAKYISGTSELSIPAKLPEDKLAEVQKEAKRIFDGLGCSGISRVDFFVRKSDYKVMFNEINTIPGFTSISMYPKMMEASGISYPDLLDKALTLAIEKWSK